MADTDSNSSNVDPILQQADAAAEALAKAGRESLRPEIDPARESALDQAFAEASKTTPTTSTDPADFGRDNAGVRPPVEGAPTAEEVAAKQQAEADAKKAVEEAAAAAAETGKAAEADKTAPEKKKSGLLDDLLADPAPKPAEEKPATDPYSEVKLRSDASPKTRETFEQLKTVAKQREEAARAEAAAARKTLEELQTKVADLEKRTVPDEVQAELKELRAFRAQFDTANDPEFRARFESRLNSNYETVYAKLQSHGLPQTEIAKLKAFSQVDRDQAIENLISKLPTMDRKFIEAKLLDNINVADERERALQEARAKADELLAKKKQEPAVQTAQRDAEVAQLLRPVLPKLDWLHVKEIPAGATPEQKKQIESANEFALQLQESLKAAIVDDSPKTRAEAALAVPLAVYYKREYAAEKARADALHAKLESITKAAATSRTARSSAAPASAAAPAPRQTPTEAADALDDLFQQETGRNVNR